MPRHLEALLYNEDGWTAEAIEAEILKRTSVDVYVIACHDQDAQQDGTPVKIHYHVYIHFGNGTKWSLSDVAKWFNVPETLISPIKSDKTDTNNRHGRYFTIRYYTHVDYPDKHYYPPEDFLSNIDVADYLAKEAERMKGQGSKRNLSRQVSEILEKCATGAITRYNYQNVIPTTIYTKYASQIGNAWKMWDDSYMAAHKGKRDCKTVWLYGDSGVGKTTLARLFAEQLGMAAYTTHAGKDPMDKYADQPFIILDELRADGAFDFPSLLKFLDPYLLTGTHSRYFNKCPKAEWIFITSVYSPRELYQEYFPMHSAIDSATQLYRRLKEVWLVQREQILISHYNVATGTFVPDRTQKNPIPEYLLAQQAAAMPQPSIDTVSVLDDICNKYQQLPPSSDGGEPINTVGGDLIAAGKELNNVSEK